MPAYVQKMQRFVGGLRDFFFRDPVALYRAELPLTNQPFYFKGTNGKGILLIHGWTSTPYELRRLGVYLNENGYTVYAPMLSGHGTVPKDLEDVEWQDWFSDVERAYARLKRECHKVSVIGTSIGGNLALILAKREQDIAGLVLMATPYRMRMERFAYYCSKIWRLFGQYKKKYYPPTFGARATVTRLVSYQTYPLDSALEAYRAICRSREHLHRITQPCLLMQSSHDHLITRDSMERIAMLISSSVKKTILVPRAYHTFISDIKNDHIFEEVLAFLEKN